MKYWTRTTHNFNNETREWEYRNDLRERDIKDPLGEQRTVGKSILGIHALDSGRWMSLHEIVESNRGYYECWKDDPYSGCDEYGYSEEAVLYDLELLEKEGVVKSKGE